MSITAEKQRQTPWPVKIEFSKSRKQLAVQFDNGELRIHSAEKLRVNSPSAEVQGHHPSEKQTVMGKENVTIIDMQAVGNYAVRLVFDDGHKTGIYTWDFLYNLT